jgi:hypothetical protein
MLVGVDDSRRRMIRFAQRFGQETLCCAAIVTSDAWSEFQKCPKNVR